MKLIYSGPFSLVYYGLQALKESYIGHLHLSIHLWVDKQGKVVLYSIFSIEFMKPNITKLPAIICDQWKKYVLQANWNLYFDRFFL